MLAQVTPMIVKVVDEPTKETTVADILIGAVGFVGVVLLAALAVGVIAGLLLFALRSLRTRLQGVDEAPSLSMSRLPR